MTKFLYEHYTLQAFNKQKFKLFYVKQRINI